jgi:alanine racemase
VSLPHRCWAEIDLIALRNNLAWLCHRIGSGNQILTVVKADAYGHGLKQIAAFLMQSGTNVFGVANINEAQDIRAVGRGWPILMLGACLPDEIEPAIKDKVMPTISSLAEAKKFSRIAKKMNKNVHAHLKIDTGMGRLGCSPDQAS